MEHSTTYFFLALAFIANVGILGRKKIKWKSGLKKIGAIWLVIFMVIGLLAWDVWPVTLRYRLTLIVDNAGTEISGSGVIEASYKKDPQWMPLPSHSEWHYDARGQAVVVDLGERGLLFALLKAGDDSRSDPMHIALKAFGFMDGPNAYPVGQRLRWISSLSRRTGEKADVSFSGLPMLVRFKDINDPKTVERVDPADMAATLGAGVSLKSVTIEITDDSVTEGVEKKLGWLGPLQGRYLNGKSTSRGSPFGLYGGDFQKGTDQ